MRKTLQDIRLETDLILLFSQNLPCFWARHRNKIQQGNSIFISTKCFINVNWSSWSTDCAAENSKPWVLLQDRRGVQTSKNWENLNFLRDSAWILVFSSSAKRREANKSNRQCEEKPNGIAYTAQSKCWGTCCCARSRAACGCGERACRSEGTYAQLVNMSRIVTHNRLPDGSLENKICTWGTNKAKLNLWRGKSRLFSCFS